MNGGWTDADERTRRRVEQRHPDTAGPLSDGEHRGSGGPRSDSGQRRGSTGPRSDSGQRRGSGGLRSDSGQRRGSTGPRADGERRPRTDLLQVDFTWSDAPTNPSGSRATPSSRARTDSRAAATSAMRTAKEQALRQPMVAAARTSATVPVQSLATATPVSALAAVRGLPAGPATAAQVPRTVVITGRGHHHSSSRRGYEARLKPHERASFKPDRVALWAVLLGLALLLGAVTSSHAATLHLALAAHTHPAAAVTALHAHAR